MREHLLQCFEHRELVPFPTGDRDPNAIETCTRRHFVITLNCACQLPDSYDEHMIMCDDCEKCTTLSVRMSTCTAPDTWIGFDCNK